MQHLRQDRQHLQLIFLYLFQSPAPNAHLNSQLLHRIEDTLFLCHPVGFTQVIFSQAKCEEGKLHRLSRHCMAVQTKPHNMAISDAGETCLKHVALTVNRPIVSNFERDVHQRGSWSSTDLMHRAAKHKERKNQSLQHLTRSYP